MSDEKELFDRDPDMSFSDFDIGKAKDPEIGRAHV